MGAGSAQCGTPLKEAHPTPFRPLPVLRPPRRHLRSMLLQARGAGTGGQVAEPGGQQTLPREPVAAGSTPPQAGGQPHSSPAAGSHQPWGEERMKAGPDVLSPARGPSSQPAVPAAWPPRILGDPEVAGPATAPSAGTARWKSPTRNGPDSWRAGWFGEHYRGNRAGTRVRARQERAAQARSSNDRTWWTAASAAAGSAAGWWGGLPGHLARPAILLWPAYPQVNRGPMSYHSR